MAFGTTIAGLSIRACMIAVSPWIRRLGRADVSAIENIGGWLTTVVARVCLNMLRSRASRREEPVDAHVPHLSVSQDDDHEVLMADSARLAVLVVLETLDSAEQLVFVLHDMFAVPFDEIASIVGRSPAATRQLASRARRRVRGVASDYADADVRRQRNSVDTLLTAARDGDFESIVAELLVSCPERNSASRVQARQAWFAARGSSQRLVGAIG